MVSFLRFLAVLVIVSPAFSFGISAQPSLVGKDSARKVVREHISDLGYQQSGRSAYSARIVGARLQENVWHFRVRYGGSLPSYSGIVLVSALTGELIDSNVPHGCEIVMPTHVVVIGGC